MNWLEVLIGALVPTLFWVPGLALGLIAGLGTGVHGLGDLGPLTLLLGGACALVALWTLLLFGPEQILVRHRLRLFIIGSGLAGYAATIGLAVMLFGGSPAGGPGWIGWMVLFAPTVVSLRYLPVLLRSK